MQRRSLNRWSSHAIGACGALVLHAMLFQAASLGARAAKPRTPQETGPGASAIVSGADLTMTLVFVHLPGVAHSDMLEELASRGDAAANAAIQVISPDPTPAFDIEAEADADMTSEALQSVGDPATRSLLFGRYTGQINARIERAWLKPRSAVAAEAEADRSANDASSSNEGRELFRCTARISQDAHGNVKEVELMRCNGTLAWQQSLVNAIQGASPLPAPPSPTVFTNALTLTFEGRQYAPGMSEHRYEPAHRELAQAAAMLQSPQPPLPEASEISNEQPSE